MGLRERKLNRARAVLGLRFGLLEKREVRWDGDMEGISFLNEGCFCQLGRERREKSWVAVRSSGGGEW